MNRKTKNTIALVGLFILLLFMGGLYIFIFQESILVKNRNKLEALKSNHYNTDQLNLEYNDLQKEAAKLDSILAKRKFNIPQNLSSISFFNFLNKVSSNFSANTQINVDFDSQKKDKEFHYFEYKLSGNGDYNDLYKLIYAIEQSKELKKITNVSLSFY